MDKISITLKKKHWTEDGALRLFCPTLGQYACLYIMHIYYHDIQTSYMFSETAWPIKAKFSMKHLKEGGTNVY